MISAAVVLATLALLAIPILSGCGERGSSESESPTSRPSASQKEGPNRVARRFSEALAARDVDVCIELSTDYLHDLFLAVGGTQRDTGEIVAAIRERFPKESASHLGLRAIERSPARLMDNLWLNFFIEGRLSEDLETGQNKYQVGYEKLRGGDFLREMTVIRLPDGRWRVSMIADELLTPTFLSAIKSQAAGVTGVAPLLRKRLELENPSSIDAAIRLAAKVQSDRTAPKTDAK